MARNATAVHRYLVRVPGARHIKVQQQKQDVSPGGRRVWANIRARNVDPRADPATYVEATTKRGFRAPWQWRAAWQSFPASWTWAHANQAQRDRQIGNAVPPPLAEALGRAIVGAG